MLAKSNFQPPQWVQNNAAILIFGSCALGIGALIGLLAGGNVLLLLVLVGGGVGAAVTVMRPDIGVALLIFMNYTRLSDVLKKEHGFPSTAQPFMVLLILVIFFRWFAYGEKPAGIRRGLLLLGLYGLVSYFSFFYAADFSRAQEAFSDYVKDVIIALIIIVLLNRYTTLRQVMWALIASGILMATISVYQQITGTYDNIYWGFGRAEIQNIIGQTNDYRIAGPIGDPNFYAQILLVIVPIAFDRLVNEKPLLLKLLAGWALAAVLLTIIFTFSRGALLGLATMVAIMFVRRPPNILTILVLVLLLAPLVQFVPPEYMQRVQTVADLIPGVGADVDTRNEVSLRGRTSEMMAAWMMFQDHPLIGVGLNNFKTHYQSYSRLLGLDQRLEARSAHSLYLTIAAELGYFGLLSFGMVLWGIFYSLIKTTERFEEDGQKEQAEMTIALTVGMIGYLLAAIFLHPAYPRYFWMLMAICLATANVLKHERELRAVAVIIDTSDGVAESAVPTAVAT